MFTQFVVALVQLCVMSRCYNGGFSSEAPMAGINLCNSVVDIRLDMPSGGKTRWNNSVLSPDCWVAGIIWCNNVAITAFCCLNIDERRFIVVTFKKVCNNGLSQDFFSWTRANLVFIFLHKMCIMTLNMKIEKSRNLKFCNNSVLSSDCRYVLMKLFLNSHQIKSAIPTFRKVINKAYKKGQTKKTKICWHILTNPKICTHMWSWEKGKG